MLDTIRAVGSRSLVFFVSLFDTNIDSTTIRVLSDEELNSFYRSVPFPLLVFEECLPLGDRTVHFLAEDCKFSL